MPWRSFRTTLAVLGPEEHHDSHGEHAASLRVGIGKLQCVESMRRQTPLFSHCGLNGPASEGAPHSDVAAHLGVPASAG